ncbi:alpha-ketoglutarate-dependent dioxygenase alkB homolog 3 isoform X4 [Alosa sapidissima]|uniref:alpha-ketoglutarate-dependent dioxygenase alkB homolog 3 isoform X4 n=1 Tax=Alosa sapidissima TaxID=34773 RepID=UPI001C09B2E0|nr:alpha-ketoglutarate-dependent dioxygenase alkB homolog 3 isoform X4 [Alosa sapidissima]
MGHIFECTTRWDKLQLTNLLATCLRLRYLLKSTLTYYPSQWLHKEGRILVFLSWEINASEQESKAAGLNHRSDQQLPNPAAPQVPVLDLHHGKQGHGHMNFSSHPSPFETFLRRKLLRKLGCMTSVTAPQECPGCGCSRTSSSRRRQTGCSVPSLLNFPGHRRPTTGKWHPVLSGLRSSIESHSGGSFNSLLCNMYRDGRDSIAWHSDNEPSLGARPTIASLSLGDTRVFSLRKQPPPEENGDYTYVERLRIPLAHGSLLMMEGCTQDDWQHQVAKEYHDRGPRINLTFRTIYPEP